MSSRLDLLKRITSALIAALAGMVLLAGCAVGPDYRFPDQPMPGQWKGPAAADKTGAVDPQALAEWWKSLNDPVLTRLVERAVADNLDLKKAWARVKEVKARRGVALADLAPTLSASGSTTTSQSSKATGSGQKRDLISTGLDVSWEIDLFGGARRSIEAAQADYEAARENLNDVLVSLAAEMAANYVQLRTYQQRLAVARQNLEIQAETLQLTALRYETGLSSGLDLERAKYNLESTRSQVPSIEAKQEEAKNRLAVLLGEWPGSLDAELSRPSPIPQAELTMTIGLPAELLRRRPDLRQAERELAAQTARVGVAKAEMYPKLTLKGSLGWEALALEGLISPAHLATSLGASLLWKVFQAGAVRENIKVQNALQEQALFKYEAAVLTALEETENALMSLAREEERRRSLAEAARASEVAVGLALKQYEAGLVDFQSVLDTQKSQASFQDNLAESEGLMTQNLISLYKALGGGWPREEPSAQTDQAGLK
ncbi:MAG: efflux transporter outer membrane subunit [Thermodesulfobacteriota bacterium]